MNKTGIINTFIKSVETNDGVVKIRGMASTDREDRMGDILAASCWTKGGMDNYSKNPIILFNHNYDRPIGKAIELNLKPDGLEIVAELPENTPEARLVKAGVLKAFSVGFRIRDADYLEHTDGLLIKDAELIEISVVSVPCNQDALFEVTKTFSGDYREALNASEAEVSKKEELMDEQELKALLERLEKVEKSADATDSKKVSAAVKMAIAEMEAAKEKAAKEAAEKAAAEEATKAAAAKAGASGAEKLLDEVRAQLADATKTASEQKELIDSLTSDLKANKEAVANLQKSKRSFQGQAAKNWQEAAESDLRDAYLVAKLSQKGWDSKIGQEVINKVNDMSGLAVSTTTVEPYETIVSTAIERDIQHDLVLAKLFRTIEMNAASMIFPILPDAGYAEFISPRTITNTGANAPHGNLAQRGDTHGSPYGGVDLQDKVLTTKKIMSMSFIANETEEDSIIPLLPLINEQIVRSQTRTIEHTLLLGGHTDAVVTGGFDGLIELGKDAGNNSQSGTAFASDSLTTDDLLAMRKKLSKYGMKPSDVIYIVNEVGYYQLLEDPEYKDASLVNDMATKITGQIGTVYGSPVIVCDEFSTPGVDKFHAVALNPRNYIMPVRRGFTLETDYQPKQQYREIIGTQRIGFSEIISGAKSVCARNYSSS